MSDLGTLIDSHPEPRVDIVAYAVARLWDVETGPDIVAYLQRIDATLAPYGGRYVIHGGAPERMEGAWSGDIVVIAFPSRRQARDWYHSPAYQEILPLRTDNSRAEVVVVDGVEPRHRATDILKSAPTT